MMRKSTFLLCAILAVVCMTTAAPAAWNSWWKDTGPDHLWTTATNWGGAGVPSAALNSEVSYVASSGKAGPVLNVAGSLFNFKIEDGYIEIVNGGSLVAGGYMTVGGYGGVEKGNLRMTGNAALSVASNFFVGDYTDGELIVEDNAVLDLYNLKLGYDGATGTVQLKGGFTECGWLVINAGSSIDITGGTFQVNRAYETLQEIEDWKLALEGMVTSNLIVTSTVGNSVDVAHGAFIWDELEQKYFGSSVLTSIPEPATIALLSFGALSLIRRKK
jgi:hypothetical protein